MNPTLSPQAQKVAACNFIPGTRVKPRSGPYQRHELNVLAVEGDRVQVHCQKLSKTLTFPAKLLRVIRGADAFAEKIVLPPEKIAQDDEAPLSERDLELIDEAWERHKVARPYDPTKILDHEGFALSVGDRITAAWQSGRYVYYGIIEKLDKNKVHGRWTEGRRAGDGDKFSVAPDQLIKVPKDGIWKPRGTTDHHAECSAAGDEPTNQAVPSEDSIKVGDRIFFVSQWFGESRKFEGVVTKVNEPPGTAPVTYLVPIDDSDLEVEREVQAPIGIFALAKIAEPENYSGDKVGILPDGLAYPFASSEFPKVEESILAAIAQIRSEGPVAPSNCSIERWQRSPGYIEARYRARSAIFAGKRGGKTSRLFIGRVGSAEYEEALAAVDRRNRIEKLQKQLTIGETKC